MAELTEEETKWYPVFYTTLVTAIHLQYPEQTALGYEWKGNSKKDEVAANVENFNAKGLQCYVGEVTFDPSGSIAEGMSAILTRKRR